MSPPPCREPIGLQTLLGYWLGELDEVAEAGVEEHFLGCGACAVLLQDVVELGDAIRVYVQQGWVLAAVTGAFVDRLAGNGLRLRQYRVPRNGSVRCTVSPADQVVVARLEAPLAGVEKLDLVWLGEEGPEQRLCDVPFAAAAGEVVFTPQIDRLRELPATTVRMQVVAVEPDGDHVLGEYTFIHTPWSSGAR